MSLLRLAKSVPLRLSAILVLVFLLAFSLTSIAAAEKGTAHNVRSADVGAVTIDGNPLRIIVAKDGSAQVVYKYSDIGPDGQFYPDEETLADQGLFVWLDGRVYGPDFENHPASAYCTDEFPTPFTEVSQTGPTGNGSASSPWVVTTTLRAGAAQIVETVTYVNGQEYARWDARITNTGLVPTGGASAQETLNLTLFHAGDIYLKGSDEGYPYYNASTGGIGGQNQDRNWFIVFQPITPATKYKEADYCTIWEDIGGATAPGAGFDNTTADPNTVIDNGAGLQWSNLSIATEQSVTISDYVSFANVANVIPTPTPTLTATPTAPAGPTATPTATSTPRPPEVPEPGSLALLVTGLAGMGGYLGLRARRLRR